jgi:acyl-CoA reductase-like NAD-dependent aldehyde dehydrogenase
MFRRQILRAPRSIIVRSSLSTQKRQAHAISNPTLANIEKRWETLPPQEQADLWMALRDRMKANWAELTVQEKKAGLSSPFHFKLQARENAVAFFELGAGYLSFGGRASPKEERRSITDMQRRNSILHRLRRPRTPRPPSSRRGLENSRLYHPRNWCFIRAVRRD